MTDELDLMHEGVKRRSGRYPWGSGENPNQRYKTFTVLHDELKKKGLSDIEIAKGLGLNSTTELRAERSNAKAARRQADAAEATRLKEKGYSTVAIGKLMGRNESSVREMLNPALNEKRTILNTTSSMLKDNLKDGGYLDVGVGTERWMGVSETVLKNSVAKLKTEEGYQVFYLNVKQLGTGKETRLKVLANPDATYSEFAKNQDKIKVVNATSKDNGRSFLGLRTPTNVSSRKIEINYAEDGGSAKDGIIELRPGVKDLSLGSASYAQVRIAVDGTHYLKGMAVYANDLPDGINIRFNTNKTKDTPKMDVMKPMKKTADGKIDVDNPFGAVIKANGQRGALNILNEEGDWSNWAGKLSSQMLSKQPTDLIKKQLKVTYDIKKSEYDDIMKLTNPTVRKVLLEKFADSADSSSVALKAVGLPRTAQKVLIPIPSMKDNEVYAPGFKNGEKVVLIRHPHGGRFEIPELTVNNKNPKARSTIKSALDAIAINPKVAAQLSGADFDGDTVLVIPNNRGSIKTLPALKALKDFDPMIAYPPAPGIKVMKNTQTEMGGISNLITDMTIRGANWNEIARAVKHSMVVIDAEKKGLNFKQSYIDNGIAELKKNYQPKGGATTLISRASSEQRVLERKPRYSKEGGPIDPATGERKWMPTGNTYVNKAGQTVPVMQKSTRMAETSDAFSLSSGTLVEKAYAEHANRLKGIANQARKEAYATKGLTYSPSAAKTYSKEVAALNGKLNIAKKNAPLERQAQLLANSIVKAKKQDNPGMDSDTIKKVERQALAEARSRMSASKKDVSIKILPSEWTAIQAGAISDNKLRDILDNTDIELVKELATPRTTVLMSAAKVARAKNMVELGYDQGEIANALGVSTSTLTRSLE